MARGTSLDPGNPNGARQARPHWQSPAGPLAQLLRRLAAAAPASCPLRVASAPGRRGGPGLPAASGYRLRPWPRLQIHDDGPHLKPASPPGAQPRSPQGPGRYCCLSWSQARATRWAGRSSAIIILQDQSATWRTTLGPAGWRDSGLDRPKRADPHRTLPRPHKQIHTVTRRASSWSVFRV
jgi:hypothetical protein